MIKKNGFGTVGALVVLIVVGLIGIAGWYVWGSRNSAQNPEPSSNNLQAETPKEYTRSATIPTDWKTYTNDEYKINLKYPSNWSVTTNLITKEIGEETQNVYSLNATKIFVICYQDSPEFSQSCSEQVSINNQEFNESLTQLTDYLTNSVRSLTKTEMTIDGHRLVEFRFEAGDLDMVQKTYLLDANGYTYGLTTVNDESQIEGGTPPLLSPDESLALFESIVVL